MQGRKGQQKGGRGYEGSGRKTGSKEGRTERDIRYHVKRWIFKFEERREST